MKIAFVGKGGSGKTTLSALFSRSVAIRGGNVLAIDADINQHLPSALGMAISPPPLGGNLEALKEYLRGHNPRISDAGQMIKTTPPGRGSRLLSLTETNPIFQNFSLLHDGMRVMSVGAFTEEDLGTKCYHSKVGAVELLLNHLIDGKNDYIVVDMTAGADAFASGLFTRFDITLLVVEPTLKSVSVYRQYKEYASAFQVHIKVIGNKVESREDQEFIQQHVGDDLVAMFGISSFIKRAEKGVIEPFQLLEADHATGLNAVQNHVHQLTRDWKRYLRDAIRFHKLNAQSWANTAYGVDLSTQVDPLFTYPEPS